MRQSLRNRLGLLKKETPEVVENVLLESLRHARRDETALICRSLIQTGRPKAISSAMRHLDRLDETCLELLARKDLDLADCARGVLRGDDLRPMPPLIRLVEQRHDATLLLELARLLVLDRGVIAKPAANAILNVTTHWLARDRSSVDRRQAMKFVDRAIVEALDAYRDHRRREILIAAALLCSNPGPNLRALLEDADDPLHFNLRSVAEELDHPLVQSNLLRWLDSKWLGRSVGRWIHTVRGVEAWAKVMTDGHLLRSHSKRNALGQADKPLRCLPTREEIAGLDDASRVGLTDFVLALPAPVPDKARTLGTLATLGKPHTRTLALNHLQALPCDEAEEATLACLDDPEPVPARLAARVVFTRKSLATRTNLVRLERSPHVDVSNQATRRLARSNVELFFERWTTLSQADRMVAAHRLHRVKRNAFLAGLRAKLEGGGEESTLLAINVLRRMGLGIHCEASLVGLTFSGQSRIVASAVMALGEGGVQRGLEAVRVALHHQDPRVQANAVESLMRLQAPETADLVTFLTESRDNRPRANAIVACHRTRRDDGERMLSTMIRDADPLHRVSAIWAARRCRGPEMENELKRLADEDRVPEIRIRAGSALRSMQPLGR